VAKQTVRLTARKMLVPEFSDYAAAVTGAGSGMGRATAMALAERGLRVAVIDWKANAADETAKLIDEAGGEARAYRLDVSKSRDVDRVFAKIAQDLGPIGYLVNVAGHDSLMPMEKISDTEWTRMFAVAVDGCFYCTRAALPNMMARRFGRIVNMSSLHAVRGQAGRVHYAAAKGAIMGLTKSLAREKASLNIRVNGVAPGPIDTPLWRGGRNAATLTSDIKERVKIIPLGRLGKAEEIAELIVFLLSEHSSYITGQIITADGGEVMP
jgi:2-hydroxycyclohexanecarboxyl-CoA dehydrogenase